MSFVRARVTPSSILSAKFVTSIRRVAGSVPSASSLFLAPCGARESGRLWSTSEEIELWRDVQHLVDSQVVVAALRRHERPRLRG